MNSSNMLRLEKVFPFLSFLLFSFVVHANVTFTGVVTDSVNRSPIEGVGVQLLKKNVLLQSAFTNASGRFGFTLTEGGNYVLVFNHFGYSTVQLEITITAGSSTDTNFTLSPRVVSLNELSLTGINKPGINTLSAIDFTFRPHQSSQDLLRFVPGLFISQHAGGGKAEQIFLRGFDIDHGTDIRISVDEMPVNMVSHAHGQGYADLHFLIPETVRKINFSKGPYNTGDGDLATAGAVKFSTYDCLRNSMVKLEGGRFDTYRGLAMLKLIDAERNQKIKCNLYNATEYYFTNGYTVSPQRLKRFNTFLKYNAMLGKRTVFTASASWFESGWNASGQIPDRLVRAGLLSRFGAVDTTEGGNTSRKNLNVVLNHTLSDKSELSNQVYITDYRFDLWSNFTFYLNDSINGDQIRQKEKRVLCGYNGFYNHTSETGNIKHETKLGFGVRFDNVFNSRLSRTIRRQFLSDTKKGDIKEANAYVFLDHSFYFTERFTATAGLRFDQFFFIYNDKLSDTSLNPAAPGIISPKLNLYYTLSDKISFFLKAGKGFHSNDARVVAAQTGKTLPSAWGSDLGSTFKLFRNWYLFSQEEFVYVGDEGIVEAAGRSERKGIELSGRFQLADKIFADIDVNYANPRLIDSEPGRNHIPLAPSLTTIGGLTLNPVKNLSISLRYRFMSDRPANEENTVTAKGYFLTDAVINYKWKDWGFNVTGENLLNREWNEAQFDTESRLVNELHPVSEIHFTPGTPFFIKAGLSRSF
jgi:hypothetical protein